MKYKYIVWIGDCSDYYVNYNDAKKAYNSWKQKGYDDVILEKII